MILNEGGNVFKTADGGEATQRINKADVEPTLKWLEKITGLDHVNFMLGSTGIKPTSGDLDVAVDKIKKVDNYEMVIDEHNIEDGLFYAKEDYWKKANAEGRSQ